MVFFQPSEAFVDWLIWRARDAIIADVGCGDGQLLKALVRKGAKSYGIDPFWVHKDGFDPLLPVFPKMAQEVELLHTHPSLIVMARPDHSGWVRDVVEVAHVQSQILYITKPENVEREVDLPKKWLTRVRAPKCQEEEVWQVWHTPLRTRRKT